MASRAQELFEQIKAGNVSDQLAFLHKLATGTAEEEYLEFKNGTYLENVKKHWSQALSGFANTEGGLLIFGIKAHKADNGSGVLIDTSNGADMVANPDELVQTLKDNRINSTVDAVPGVQYFTVKETSGKGFVVVLIPEGPHKPYRAEVCEPKKYYWQRVGDSFIDISHSMLRSLFYPRITSNLDVAIKIEQDGKTYRFISFVRNIGIATASNLAVHVEFDRKLEIRCYDPFMVGTEAIGACPWGSAKRFITTTPLHSGDRMRMFIAEFNAEGEATGAGIKMRLGLYLMDQEPVLFHHMFSWHEVSWGDASLERCEIFPNW